MSDNSVSIKMMQDLEPIQLASDVRFKFRCMEVAKSCCDDCASFARFSSRGISLPTSEDRCGFCHCSRENAAQTRCTYGLAHDFLSEQKSVVKSAKRDDKLCTKCGVHPKNPASQTNGCNHSYTNDSASGVETLDNAPPVVITSKRNEELHWFCKLCNATTPKPSCAHRSGRRCEQNGSDGYLVSY